MFKDNFSKIRTFLDPSRFLEDQDSQALSLNQKIWQTVQIVCFSIILAFLAVLLASNIVSLFGYEQADNNNLFAVLSEMPLWAAFLLVVIIGPFLEELAFRLSISVSPKAFYFGLPFLIFYLSDSVAGAFLDTESLFTTALVGSLLVLTILFCLFFWTLFPREKTITFLKKRFNWIFWILSILFALVHAGNYSNLETFWFLIPLLVLPQFLVGLGLGFIRVKYGFEWSFVAHSLYNFLISLPVFLFSVFAGSLEEFGRIFNETSSAQATTEDLSQFLGPETYFVVFTLFVIYTTILGVAIYFSTRLFRKLYIKI